MGKSQNLRDLADEIIDYLDATKTKASQSVRPPSAVQLQPAATNINDPNAATPTYESLGFDSEWALYMGCHASKSWSGACGRSSG